MLGYLVLVKSQGSNIDRRVQPNELRRDAGFDRITSKFLLESAEERTLSLDRLAAEPKPPEVVRRDEVKQGAPKRCRSLEIGMQQQFAAKRQHCDFGCCSAV